MNGPVNDRKCQDTLCFILFWANILALFVIGMIGFTNGHPDRLTLPFDPDGNACGLTKGVED